MFWLYVWGPLRPFHYPSGGQMRPIVGVVGAPAFRIIRARCHELWKFWQTTDLERTSEPARA